MPAKNVPPVFSPAQQVMRARLAAIDPTQFVALKAILGQAAAAIDVRIAQLDAERAQLNNQKTKLAAVLAQLGKPAALDSLRTAISKGHKLVAPIASIKKKPEKVPKKPKRPGG